MCHKEVRTIVIVLYRHDRGKLEQSCGASEREGREATVAKSLISKCDVGSDSRALRIELTNCDGASF